MPKEVRVDQRADARENRARILEATREALAFGGRSATIREIARLAQVGPATVYRHFRTKEELLDTAFANQMHSCSMIMEQGLAAPDPWLGFRSVVERTMEMHALNRGFARAFTSRLPYQTRHAAERGRILDGLVQLVERAKAAGSLRPEFVIDDLSLAFMANDGIHVEPIERRLAATRRFAALMLESFHVQAISSPLPMAVPLPLLSSTR